MNQAATPASSRDGAGALLEIEDLSVEFRADGSVARALSGVNLRLSPGEIVGMAGESGSGKSTAAIAVMGLLPRSASVTGSIRYRGRELVGLAPRELRGVRGREIAMVFQETITALNPVVRVGDQLVRAVMAHVTVERREAQERVRESLRRVRLHDTERVLRSYPSELSGGMCQRVLIAMALGCGSRILLADEPTTALDVSVQREILALMQALAAEGLAILLISHDLAVLNKVADRLMVLYAGQVVEEGLTSAVIGRASHPYSRALMECVPHLRRPQASFVEIPEGAQPTGYDVGCRFRSRCTWRIERCEAEPAFEAVAGGAQRSRCWRAHEVLARQAGER